MTSIRLGFAGASGTGKTTLAEWVVEELGLPLNPVGSRSVAKAMGYDNPYDVDAAGKRGEFQRRLITEKADWEAKHDSFVSDRTTLDNLVYTMLHEVYAVDAKFLVEVVAGLQRYTHIVFCPVDIFCNVSGDANRVGGGEHGSTGDLTYHCLFDTTIRALLDKHRGPRPSSPPCSRPN